MALIVQKFGGSSVADTARIRNVARIITETYRKGNNVVVVLSAQGDTTDDLIAKAEEINTGASRREADGTGCGLTENENLRVAAQGRPCCK